MDDVLKGLALGLFALAAIHISLERRAHHDAVRQVREAFHNEGTLRVGVQPRGLFGLYASDLWSIDIYGSRLRVDSLPFTVTPRAGWKGSIRHLRLHLSDFTLDGYPVQRFDADIPFVTYDIGYAVWKDRLMLRGAGTGPATVLLTPQDLRTFIQTKYRRLIDDIDVWIQNDRVYLSGQARLLGTVMPFTAYGVLTPRAGRYVDLTDATVRLNGAVVSPRLADALLKSLNPVLDTVTDLGLGGFVTITSVHIDDRYVTVEGDITVPLKKEESGRKTEEEKPSSLPP